MKRALLSVSDKTNIVPLAKFLTENKVEIISTGGTAKLLSDNRITHTPISEVTGNPEAFGGRMKTISFQVESAILYRRDHADDLKDAKELGIESIDLVVCNLYPFQEVSKKTKDEKTLIENIDIGGPTMIRAAAKNFDHVTILTNPAQYESFMENFNTLDKKLRFSYAMEAFKMTAEYDQFIFNTLTEDRLCVATTDATELRYGENPHQKAWMIPWKNTRTDKTLANAEIIQGKALSYNNMIDMDAGWKCTSELSSIYNNYVTTIIKHANPCGVAISKSSNLEALENAWACDPVSSFGSIISFNTKVDIDVANWLTDKFVEIIIAPEFSRDALEKFSKKKNLRLVCTPNKDYKNAKEQVVKSINGALLVQEEDEFHQYEYKNMTSNHLTEELTPLKSFGMVVNKYLKSNSISLVGTSNNCYILAGGGMGQPNRLDSLRLLAGPRAKALGHNMENLLLISDAFFPFRDSIDACAELGVKYIIQPGGSIRDEEVISACNEHGIAMEFTSVRHFRH